MFPAVADGFSMRELYRDASSPSFLRSQRLEEIQQLLGRGLQQLSEEKAAALMSDLVSVCECRRDPSELADIVSSSQVETQILLPLTVPLISGQAF